MLEMRRKYRDVIVTDKAPEGLRAPAAEHIRPVTVKITQRLQKGFYF